MLILDLIISKDGIFMLCEVRYNCDTNYNFTKVLNMYDDMECDDIVSQLQEDVTHYLNKRMFNCIEELIDKAVEEYAEFYFINEDERESDSDGF